MSSIAGLMLLCTYGLCVSHVWQVYCASCFDHQGLVKKILAQYVRM